MAYASGTEVSIDRSRAEIEKVLAKAGAKEFAYWRNEEGSNIAFRIDGLMVRLTVAAPKPPADNGKKGQAYRKYKPEQQVRWVEDEEKRRWRVILIAVKAKLELVAMQQSTILREFMADTVMVNGKLVAEELEPRIRQMYELNKMPKTLLLGSGS